MQAKLTDKQKVDLDRHANDREAQARVLAKTKEAHEKYVAADKAFKAAEKGILNILVAAGRGSINLIGKLFRVFESKKAPKVARIGGKEVIEGILEKGWVLVDPKKETDGVVFGPKMDPDKLYADLLADKAKKNTKDVEGKKDYALSVEDK